MDYGELIAAWSYSPSPPAEVTTGTPLTEAMTPQEKIDVINGWKVAAADRRVLLTPSQILNAIVFADLAALQQLQVSQLTLLLAGATVDASAGTPIRLGIQALFAGKTQTLQNLAALVAPFDNAEQSWCSAHGYPTHGDVGNLTLSDAENAGLTSGT